MAFKFPFTNYHELNLTWVLEQLKKLFEDSEENVETIESYENRLSAVETELPVVEATADQAAQTANAAATLAQTAKTTADTANENALDASAQAGLARQEAATAEAEAQAATQAAQQAQATAQNFDGRITQAEENASEALQEAQSFENRVNAAINTANNAVNTATIAQGIAVNANQNAATALDTAQTADGKAEAAQDTADTNADNIGDLSELTTTVKSDLVSAINEVVANGGAVDSVNGQTGDVILNAGDIAIVPGLVYLNGTTGKAVNTLAASVAPVESSGTASRSYSVGELLIYNYQLYKVTSQIAAGGSFIIGTNIIATTVKNEIASGGQVTTINPITARDYLWTQVKKFADISGYDSQDGMQVNNNEFIIPYDSGTGTYQYATAFSGTGGYRNFRYNSTLLDQLPDSDFIDIAFFNRFSTQISCEYFTNMRVAGTSQGTRINAVFIKSDDTRRAVVAIDVPGTPRYKAGKLTYKIVPESDDVKIAFYIIRHTPARSGGTYIVNFDIATT